MVGCLFSKGEANNSTLFRIYPKQMVCKSDYLKQQQPRLQA